MQVQTRQALIAGAGHTADGRSHSSGCTTERLWTERGQGLLATSEDHWKTMHGILRWRERIAAAGSCNIVSGENKGAASHLGIRAFKQPHDAVSTQYKEPV